MGYFKLGTTVLHLDAGSQTGLADNTEQDVGSNTLFLPVGTWLVVCSADIIVTSSVDPTYVEAYVKATDSSNNNLTSVSRISIGNVNATTRRQNYTAIGSYTSAGVTVKLRALINNNGGTVTSRDVSTADAFFIKIA